MEICIVQCDFTGKMTQPSSVTQLSSPSKLSNPHWQITTMCPKKSKTSKSERAWLIEDAHCQSVLIMCVEKNWFCLRNTPEKSPQYHHFTRQNALFDKILLLFFPQNFSRPPSGARIPIKPQDEMDISKFWIETWQGFCHPKIVSYKIVQTKMAVKLPWSFAIFFPY